MGKLDIRKDIASRKYKQTNRFFYWIYRTVMKIVGKKHRAHYEKVDDVNDCKGPCFVIFNHLSRLDHMYVMEICYPRRINMVAGYSEFFRSHLHFAFKHNNILPKKQYVNDFVGTKAIMSIIKQGGCVAFAPEGLASNDGTPKPIVPYTGHMLKKFKVPVYFVELRGQYLQNTKVCLDERYGETYAKISLLFSPEDLEKYSGEEIDAKINEAFRHDEYEWQKQKRIKWDMRSRPCYRLDHLLYRCPKCGREFEMESGDDYIRCRACGNGATVDDYYEFHPLTEDCVIPDSPSKWALDERKAIIDEIRANPQYVFAERVKIGRLPNDEYVKNKGTSVIVGEGVFSVDHSGIHYRGEGDSKYDFDVDYSLVYTTISEQDASFFNIYIGGEYTDFFPQTRMCAMKVNMLIEEMHRLPVNFYKNFPWLDYLYEDDKK